MEVKIITTPEDLTRNEHQADCSDPGSGRGILTPSSGPSPSLLSSPPNHWLLCATAYNPAALSAYLILMSAWNFEKPQLHVYTQNTALQPTTWSVDFSRFPLNWYHYLNVSNNTVKWKMFFPFFLVVYNRGKDALLQSHSLLNHFAPEWDFSWLQKIGLYFQGLLTLSVYHVLQKQFYMFIIFKTMYFLKSFFYICEKRQDKELDIQAIRNYT